jgi:DNA-binding NarL/FixJ family response regulator
MEAIPTLIVDDDEDVLMLVRLVIETANEGLSVAGEAPDGTSAVELCDDVRPSVIVLDQMMPGMTGIETARAIRERHPGIPIVLFSAYLDERLRSEASDAGIDVSLPKDDVQRIPDVLRELMRERSA